MFGVMARGFVLGERGWGWEGVVAAPAFCSTGRGAHLPRLGRGDERHSELRRDDARARAARWPREQRVVARTGVAGVYGRIRRATGLRVGCQRVAAVDERIRRVSGLRAGEEGEGCGALLCKG